MHLGVEFFVVFFFKGADLIHPPWDPFIYMFRYLISVRSRASTLTDLTHTQRPHMHSFALISFVIYWSRQTNNFIKLCVNGIIVMQGLTIVYGNNTEKGVIASDVREGNVISRTFTPDLHLEGSVELG